VEVAWSRVGRWGIKRRAPGPRRDPHKKWKDEAQLWVDRLVRAERNTDSPVLGNR